MWLNPGQKCIKLPITTHEVRRVILRTRSHLYALQAQNASDFDQARHEKGTPQFYYFDPINRRLYLTPTPEKRFSMEIGLLLWKTL